VAQLDKLAEQRFRKHVIHLAIRWMLDQGITTALWGARHPGQLQPVGEVSGWELDASAKAEIDRILKATISDPVDRIHGAAGAQPQRHKRVDIALRATSSDLTVYESKMSTPARVNC
jgi:hypothetical protein